MSTFWKRCHERLHLCVCHCLCDRQDRLRSVQIDPQILVWEYELATKSSSMPVQPSKASEVGQGTGERSQSQSSSSQSHSLSSSFEGTHSLPPKSRILTPILEQDVDQNYSSSTRPSTDFEHQLQNESTVALVVPSIVIPDSPNQTNADPPTTTTSSSSSSTIAATTTGAAITLAKTITTIPEEFEVGRYEDTAVTASSIASTTASQTPDEMTSVSLMSSMHNYSAIGAYSYCRDNLIITEDSATVASDVSLMDITPFPLLSWRTYDKCLSQPEYLFPESCGDCDPLGIVCPGDEQPDPRRIEYTQYNRLWMSMDIPEHVPRTTLLESAGIKCDVIKNARMPHRRLVNAYHACIHCGFCNQVHLAKCQETGELVAIKVQLTLQRKRAELELKVFQRIRFSPFLVRLHSYFSTMIGLYLVMEYVPGGKLTEKLTAPFSLLAIAFYSGQIVLALCHLHRRGVLYRDLKPDNILLTGSGYLKLCDFGSCSTGISGNRKVKVSTGTPRYWAPEKFIEQPYSHPSDWWSLGIIVYQMLTAKHPFANFLCNYDTYKGLVLDSDPPYHTHCNPHALSLCKGLLNKDPEERLGGAHEKLKVYEHPFYQRFLHWETLRKQQLRPPPMYATRNKSLPAYRE